MRVKELIRKKRDGKEHSKKELEFLVRGFTHNEIPDYQFSAWLMAVFFRGLTREETSWLTEIMWKSGRSLPRTSKNQYFIDKHSTGGVGDKPSLIIVPLVRSTALTLDLSPQICIPMVSGRGLGHTGGTLDKLEAVPGFRIGLNEPEALKLLEDSGFFMMGQTEDLAPADRLIYALRDATGTVESLPLMISSILSKKFSESLDGLVLDIKTGEGAFLKNRKDSEELACRMIEVCRSLNLDVVALMTSMEEPLGRAIGHSLEVEECFNFLKGENLDSGLQEVVVALASWMVHLGSRKKLSLSDAKTAVLEEWESRRPVSLFVKMFKQQGGDWERFLSERESKKKTYGGHGVRAKESGYLSKIAPERLGIILTEMGGGRLKKSDPIDPEPGYILHKKVGESVKAGETLIEVFCAPGKDRLSILEELNALVEISKSPVAPTKWVVEIFQ